MTVEVKGPDVKGKMLLFCSLFMSFSVMSLVDKSAASLFPKDEEKIIKTLHQQVDSIYHSNCKLLNIFCLFLKLN